MRPASSAAGQPAEEGARALARRFGDALRVGGGLEADRAMSDALAAGLGPAAIQSLVIEPAMVGIGELWESRHLTVADEHLATSICQRAMLRLYEFMVGTRAPPRREGHVLLAAVEGQHHVLGLRMAADLLEGAGFDVLYLGADVPVDSLRSFAARHRPAIVGLAFGIPTDVGALADSLWAIHDVVPDVRAMLGGRAVPSAFEEAGYPVIASSMEALEAVESLLASPPRPMPELIRALRSDRAADWPRETAVEADEVAERLAAAADDAFTLAREHARRAEDFRALALRDPLTGMPNRRAFEDELIALAARGTRTTLLTVDVDSFKSVNDQHGHQTGDEVLVAVGRAIARSLREGDMAARVGGDEFAVLLPDTSVEVARRIAERIRATAATSTTPPITLSAGIAELAADSREAVLAADMALYEAKAAGRDRVAGPAGR